LQPALLRAGLSCRALPAEDAVRPGIQTVPRLLGRRSDGSRGLSVAPRCVHTIAEYGMYQYPPDPASGSAAGSPPSLGEGPGERVSELPMKQNDHAMDATRYALYTALARARATEGWMELYLKRRV
jgi:hypothetical protein